MERLFIVRMPIRKSIVLSCLLVGSAALAHEFSGPHGTVILDWEVPNVSRVISSGYGDSFGIEAAVNMGFPEMEIVEGRQCINGSYFLFDVEEEFAFDIDETVTLEILFDRTRSSGLWVSHDRNAMSEPLQEIRFEPSEEQWYTHTVRLERARFANRGESGSDFAIAALSAMWPGTPDENHRMVICDLRIVRSNETIVSAESGDLKLNVGSNSDDTTPARIGLYDASGRMPLPGAAALTIRNYDDLTKQVFLRTTHSTVTPWPHSNRYFFYMDGEYEASLPEGSYSLIVSKGPEYELVSRQFEIRAGEVTAIDILLERWTDMPDRGWYSGDDHVHMIRNEEDNASISAIMQAEDVHVTNVLQMGNPFDTHFRQYAFGEDGRYVEGNHALVSGVEDPRTAVRGHTLSMNISEVLRPSEKYLRYEQIFAGYREQGGLSGYAHVAGELFNVGRGLAIDVPLGAVDFVEILQDGILATELWYDFLNLGFALTPTAGSDFPYLSAPGGERNYVYVGGTFSTDAWYAQLRANRTFVTNGPMLEFTINGQPVGSHIDLLPGDEINIVASVAMKPDIEPLDRLELIAHGEIVAVADNVSADNSLSLSYAMRASDGVWLAVRAFGRDQAKAHSAPIFVTVGEGFEKVDAIDGIVRKMLAYLDEYDAVQADPTSELEGWSVSERLEKMVTEQRAEILRRADLARIAYASMLDRS
jgi:hypothetical protein